MTQVDIEYCVPCGHRDTAMEVQEALLERYGQQLSSVSLVTGDGGVFTVSVDGDLVFDKAEEEFSVEGILERVESARTATA